MSGSSPKYSLARNLPVRPNPDWISSAIVRMPCVRQSAWIPGRNAPPGTM